MSLQAENDRLRRCITMAMGCITPLSKNTDERLAWYRLLDALEGREARHPRDTPAPTPQQQNTTQEKT